MSRAILFVVLLCFVSKSFGKTLSECELVRELRKHGFPEHQLKDWVCVANVESAIRTNAVGSRSIDGSHEYGIFQISDSYWCSASDKPGKGCNVRCEDLLLDDISKSVQCAKTIFDEFGLEPWDHDRELCVGEFEPKIDHC